MFILCTRCQSPHHPSHIGTLTARSQASFALAVVGTFFMGIATECLTAFRRCAGKSERTAWLRKNRLAWTLLIGCIFTTQVLLGYFLMLIAMTYQTELFVAVVLGIGVGHTVLNVRAPVGESVDACCVDDAEPSRSRTNGTSRPDKGQSAQVEQGAPALRVADDTCCH